MSECDGEVAIGSPVESQFKGRFTHSMPFPCRAAKGVECVFPVWFTQCGRIWFTLAMPCSDHAVLLKATAQHGRRETVVLCCSLEKNGMVGAFHGHGMASVNQTRLHCVNQMGKPHSKPLAALHGRGTEWARHGHGMLCVNRPLPKTHTRMRARIHAHAQESDRN